MAWGHEPGADGTRAAVEAGQRRLPPSYFTESAPMPAGWPSRPGAYLAFGDRHAGERAAARELGWPTRTLAGSTCTCS